MWTYHSFLNNFFTKFNRQLLAKFCKDAKFSADFLKPVSQFSEKLKSLPLNVPPAAKLVILRHCFKLKTSNENWNSLHEYKHYKTHDTPLSKTGLEQSEFLCYLLKHQKFDRILSSPYRRCIETVLPVVKYFNLKVCVDAGLCETTKTLEHVQGFEKLQKLKNDYTSNLFNGGHIFDDSYQPVLNHEDVKSVETKIDSAERVVATVKQVLTKYRDERILICTHSTPCGALLKHFCNEKVYFRFGTAAFLYENDTQGEFSFTVFNSLED